MCRFDDGRHCMPSTLPTVMIRHIQPARNYCILAHPERDDVSGRRRALPLPTRPDGQFVAIHCATSARQQCIDPQEGQNPRIGLQALFHPIANIEDAQTLAQAIVNTIHEPFLVLDEQFRVLAASRSFYETFKVDPEQTQGCLLYELGDGQWDIPALRLLLETIIPEKTAMDGFEVDHDFPGVGRRIMLLNARKVIYDDSPAIDDPAGLHRRHRPPRGRAGKGRTAGPHRGPAAPEAGAAAGDGAPRRQQPADHRQHPAAEGPRRHFGGDPRHLRDAHQRVMSVAAVQRTSTPPTASTRSRSAPT